MATKKNSILQEAIADAKAVRETALANARLAIEEAFTPHLKSMLSAKLKAEAEEPEKMDGKDEYPEKVTEAEDTFSVTKDTDSSKIGGSSVTVDEPGPTEPSATASSSTDIKNDKTLVKAEGVDTEFPTSDPNKSAEDPSDVDKFAEDAGLDSPSEPYADDQDDEEDLDLEAIIRELEKEPESDELDDVGDTQPDAPTNTLPAATPSDDTDPTSDDDVKTEDISDLDAAGDKKSDDDDEIDLEEILLQMEQEDKEATDDSDVDDLRSENAALRGELKEYVQAVKLLRSRLQEQGILNAKLLYTNKLFKSYNMNVGQKMRVIETFDRAQTVRETKLIYATLAESFNDGSKVSKKQRVVESQGSASRVTTSTAPAPEVLSEGRELASRFKKLAGIK